MWDVRIDTLDEGRVRRVGIERDGEPVSYAKVLELWQGDEDGFGALFSSMLAEAPYRAYLSSGRHRRSPGRRSCGASNSCLSRARF